MISTLLITALLITTLLIYLYNTKNKYQNPDYLNYLIQINLFFDSISNFDDYITWVKRDEIKNQFSLVGRFFKNKSKYYKNESNVKEFNEIFNDFEEKV
jgi:DNA helicase-4